MKVTAVLCTKDEKASFLRQSLESLKYQTRPLDSVIVVNDGGVDVGELSRSVLGDVTTLKYLNNQKNLGLTASLNRAIALAEGQIILRQDSDDISDHNRVYETIKLFEKDPDISLVGTWTNYIDMNGEIIKKFNPPESHNEILAAYRHYNPFVHGSIAFKKSSFNEVGGYNTKYRYTQDLDFTWRISEKFKTANIPNFLYYHRLNQDTQNVRKIAGQLKNTAKIKREHGILVTRNEITADLFSRLVDKKFKDNVPLSFRIVIKSVTRHKHLIWKALIKMCLYYLNIRKIK